MIARFEKGFTLVELIIVIGIISILSTMAVIKFRDWYEDYKFLEEVSKLEYVIRRAKVIALERSSYIRVRVSGSNLLIEDCGINNTSCSPIFSYRFNYNLESTGEVLFDPRGLFGSPPYASFCVSKDSMSYKVIVNRAGIRVKKGGTC